VCGGKPINEPTFGPVRLVLMVYQQIVRMHTFHVDRSRFDQLLLRHARSLGSRIVEGVRVERAEFGSDGFVTGVCVKQEPD